MAEEAKVREHNFTTIRIRKVDKARLEKLALPREALWETVRRITESSIVKKI
jgi:hypothetical protein|tara:strand:- start:563 stop:718 length:156 start_codon:yes stop_codon:yes gene_type:complete